jgi:hypothetical protein
LLFALLVVSPTTWAEEEAKADGGTCDETKLDSRVWHRDILCAILGETEPPADAGNSEDEKVWPEPNKV